jgi:hypothetical protein
VSSLLEWEDGDEGEGIRLASLPFGSPTLPPKKTALGQQGKAVGCAQRRRLCCLWLDGKASDPSRAFFCVICEQPKQQVEADFTQNGRKQGGHS